MTSGPSTAVATTAANPADTRLPSWWQSPAILPAIAILFTGYLIGRESMTALALTVLDGGAALGVLLSAALAGGWLVRLLGLGDNPLRDRLIVGAGLGVGLLSSIVLCLGMAGVLTRSAMLVLVGTLAISGILSVLADLWPLLRRTPRSSDVSGVDPIALRRQVLAINGLHYLWLLACPFLALAAMAAANPPGVLWVEEAGGYDVLEYHLAVPREFLEAGHIFFMPYNVYSNFPLNGEMISLLMMALRGNAIEASFMAQMANVALGILLVAAAWWVGRLYSPQAGILAGVLVAISPWVVYLSGIAFVEPGMLAMGMLSLGAMLRAIRNERYDIRWLVVAGLLGGYAAGYKYTAIPLLVIPIALLPLFSRMGWTSRFRCAIVFALASIITFSPWMLRNVVNTRNPVFPLAYNVFGAKASTWDDVLNARWQRAHGLTGSGLSESDSKFIAAWQRTTGDPRFGIVLVGLAGLGAIIRRDRWTAMFLAMLFIQFGVWLFATHLFARFAVVLVLPLTLMAVRLVELPRSRAINALISLTVMVGAGLNLYDIRELYYKHTRATLTGESINVYGRTNLFVKGQWPGFEALQVVNELDSKACVLMVGEARTFYVLPPRKYAVVFNHHPLAQALRRCTPPDAATPDGKAVLAWMREQGITHVLVNWMELDRLRMTYGMDDGLDEPIFDRLETAGLTRMGDWSMADHEPPYVTLYEVPNE